MSPSPQLQLRTENQSAFRTDFSEAIFNQKYRHEGAETWDELANTLAWDVAGRFMSAGDLTQLAQYISDMKFIPGGRYLYYAGRKKKFFNNCFLLAAEEDTREDWANLSWRAESALMSGGGIGYVLDVYREEGAPLVSTGGTASGPLPKALMINEIGRNVMQGGSRRSAIWFGLSDQHPDASKLLDVKDWDNQPVGVGDVTIGDIKKANFNFPAPLDMTNITLNYGDDWLSNYRRTGDVGDLFRKNVGKALRNGEPGFGFNFGAKSKEVLRNACTEVTSEDDSDVCNLGSLNLSRIESLQELRDVTRLATMFLICGTLRADLPFAKIYDVRNKNRRLGLGLMGVHEWLIQRGHKYEVVPELHDWLEVYETVSDSVGDGFADRLGISRPVAKRAIAPTGTLGIVAGTTTGIEPLFAVAYMRRYLKGGSDWHYQYVIDGTAKLMIDQYGANPEEIESAIDLAADYERRIRFQADIQDYVDMAISSTINLPAWGTDLNNEDKVDDFADTLAKYAPRLRGFTVYPDGARGGQPLTPVLYSDAIHMEGIELKEHDVCDITGKGGSCGV